MSLDWSALNEPELVIEHYELRDVIIDFNGPQLATYQDKGGSLWLGVAVDELDERLERWLLTPVTSRELRALASGLLGTRDAFKSKELSVLDLDWSTGEFVRSWRAVSSGLLDPDALPDASASLEGFMNLPESQPEHVRSFTFDHARFEREGIGFQPLSDALHNLQRVWSAIAQALETKPTARGRLTRDIQQRSALRTVALRAGSIVVELRESSDEELNDQIAESFARLLNARDDGALLTEQLTSLKARVHTSYEDFLRALQRGDMEFEFNYKARRGYMSPQLASCTRERLQQVTYMKEESDVIELCGYFSAFDLNGSFAFEDEMTSEKFQGSISPNAELTLPISVGEDAAYYVFLDMSVVTLFNKETKTTS